MKKSTCANLRGACGAVITGETADEMGENCKQHVSEMMERGDELHLKAVEDMKALSQEKQMAWYQDFVNGFDSLEEA